MTTQPTFDKEAAHKYFSANCFNAAWEYIDKSDRTDDENQRMISLANASVWHWTQRSDCVPNNLSIGYWQLSRVYALASQAENARRYAKLCLDISPDDEPFSLGYAHEAMARAEMVAGNQEKMNEHLAEAKRLAECIADALDKELLINDLGTIH